MRKRDHNIFANAASLLICGVLAGVVVAAAAFPAIAMGGLAAKASADGFGELPTELDTATPPPQITYVYASDDKTLLATFYDENRHDIPLADVPQVMQDAILAAEDQQFYDHNGVDLQGIVRAFVANQQTHVDPGRVDADHAVRAAADHVLGHQPGRGHRRHRADQRPQAPRDPAGAGARDGAVQGPDPENYLNIAAFGHGAYGIYAASQVYFNKEPKDLTLEEAALLAALPKAPERVRPGHRGGPAAGARAAQLRPRADGRARQDHARSSATPPSRPRSRSPATARPTAASRRSWRTGASSATTSPAGGTRRSAFGKDVGERNGRLRSGGYRSSPRMDVDDPGLGEAQRRDGDPDRQLGRAHAGRDRARHRPGPSAGGQPQLRQRRLRKPALHRPRARRPAASRGPTRRRPTR